MDDAGHDDLAQVVANLRHYAARIRHLVAEGNQELEDWPLLGELAEELDALVVEVELGRRHFSVARKI